MVSLLGILVPLVGGIAWVASTATRTILECGDPVMNSDAYRSVY